MSKEYYYRVRKIYEAVIWQDINDVGLDNKKFYNVDIKQYIIFNYRLFLTRIFELETDKICKIKYEPWVGNTGRFILFYCFYKNSNKLWEASRSKWNEIKIKMG